VLRPRLGLRLAGLTVALGLAALLILWLTPSSDYILLPDRAKPVAPLVTIPHEGISPSEGKGGIFYVDVLVRRFPGLHAGATIVPAHAINPPGVNETQRRQSDLRDMSRSQDIAAAVALRKLGYTVIARPIGILISQVDAQAPAAGKLQPSDLITAVDGSKVLTITALRAAMRAKRPGDEVRYTVVRGKQTVDVSLKTIAATDNAKRAIAGFAPEQGTQLKLPVAVRIDAGEIGGPSAGLAFALDVVEELGRKDIARGNVVAVTGEIFLDGTVGSVGGVEQKTIGARKAGATIFIVPAGDNAREARRFAEGMRIVPVESFQQALSALATLPAAT
jgi:Lon-like protease